MNDRALPPHLRDPNRQPRQAELELPLDTPEVRDRPPQPERDEQNERPVDPFLRRS